MPFNGGGVFTRLYSWVADAAAGIDITASRTDADSDDIVVNGLGNCITRDGQGKPTANLPMAGFRHTGAASGVGSGDYVTIGQLSGTTGAAPGAVPVGSGIDFFGPFAPTGWHFAAGQAISRTVYATLFAVIGTTYGVGDGSTTFNLPDKRGRISLPLDNLGGTAASRVTVFAATTIGDTGGDQNLATHDHTLADPTHTHAATVSDPSHNHTLTDPGHIHTLPGNLMGSGPGLNEGSNFAYSGTSTNSATTGITMAAAATGISVTNAAAATGITIANAGTGSGANMPPVLVCTYIIFAGA